MPELPRPNTCLASVLASVLTCSTKAAIRKLNQDTTKTYQRRYQLLSLSPAWSPLWDENMSHSACPATASGYGSKVSICNSPPIRASRCPAAARGPDGRSGRGTGRCRARPAAPDRAWCAAPRGASKGVAARRTAVTASSSRWCNRLLIRITSMAPHGPGARLRRLPPRSGRRSAGSRS